MPTVIEYDREKALAYARRWAMDRNPQYLDFENMGGDCTNYASQCIYAGCGVMNYTPTMGWYYISGDNRAPAWTGVPYLYNFLITNEGLGPFAEEIPVHAAQPGDIIQLGNSEGRFYHSPVVNAVAGGRIFVSAHTFDAYMRPLDSYYYAQARGLHILGARTS